MDQHTRVVLDNRFSTIPHWITLSDLSDGAVRLYLVLFKYADRDDGTAFPSRRTLARDLRKSVKSVDRAIKELASAGALRVTRRRRKGTAQNYTNLYTVVTANPHVETLPDVVEVDAEEVATLVSPGGDTSVAENYTQPTYTQLGFTSDPGGSEQQEKQLHPQPDGRGRAPEERNDPIGPAFADSDDRRTLINDIWAVAKHNSTPGRKGIDHIVKGIDLVDRFDTHLVDMFGTDDLLDHLIWDMNWQPPRACTDRKEAGKWLNTFLRAWATEAGPLTWRAEK